VQDTKFPDVPLIFCEGKCGGPVAWHFSADHPKFKDEIEGKSSKKEKQEAKKEIEKEKELADKAEGRKVLIPKYPKSQEDNYSMKIWATVSQSIIANDMDKGDLEKNRIEEKQRGLFQGLAKKRRKMAT